MVTPVKNMKMEAYKFYNSVWHREEELQGVISKLYKVSTDLLAIVQTYNNGENCPGCGTVWVEMGEDLYVCPNTECELTNATNALYDIKEADNDATE